jgi:hypothetical protein
MPLEAFSQAPLSELPRLSTRRFVPHIMVELDVKATVLLLNATINVA